MTDRELLATLLAVSCYTRDASDPLRTAAVVLQDRLRIEANKANLFVEEAIRAGFVQPECMDDDCKIEYACLTLKGRRKLESYLSGIVVPYARPY